MARPQPRHRAQSRRPAPSSVSLTPTAASSSGGFSLTRRQLLIGAAGIAGLAAVLAAGYEISEGATADKTPRLAVAADAVFTTENCEAIEDVESVFAQTGTFHLPYGSQLFSSDGEVAIALVPADTASPLVGVQLLSLASGTANPLLTQAAGASEGFEVFDVRATASGAVWIEENILDGRWRVYSAPLTDGTVNTGAAAIAAEGDGEWEIPTIAACGRYAFWQLLPQRTGSQSSEDSLVYRVPFGGDGSRAEELYRSHGRFATAISAGSETITITPRSENSASSYELVALDAKSGQTIDHLPLTASMAPIDASYGPTGFSFTFDAIYNYGDGLANLGTYTPAESTAAGTSDVEAYGNQAWFRFDRAPIATPASCGDWFIVKSTSAVCAVDLANRRYAAIPVPNGSDTYGEYLATTGDGPRVVTFANVDHTPPDGEAVHECTVRVWEPVTASPLMA